MKQVTLSKRDIKELNTDIAKMYGISDFFSEEDFITLADDTYVLRNGELSFFYKEALLVPTLKMLLRENFLAKVMINMGAIPFIAKGADLMRPGIVAVDARVSEGSIVVIMDEKNMKPIAVGQSLFSKEEMEKMEAGKMVINLHHVGDEFWNFTTEA